MSSHFHFKWHTLQTRDNHVCHSYMSTGKLDYTINQCDNQNMVIWDRP